MDVPTLGIAILAVIAVPLLTTLGYRRRRVAHSRTVREAPRQDPTVAVAPPRSASS